MMSNSRKSLWLGSLGVLIFALTIPMTRLATGTASAPALSPWFVSFGRAALAGFFSILYLLFLKFPRPDKEDYFPLVFAAIANVLGWPILLALGLRYVESIHASVITGILPLATAGVAALVFRRRPSIGFWFFAGLGAALVVAFSCTRNSTSGGGSVHWADILLLLAVLSAASGYAVGGRLSQKWPGEIVICWMLTLLIPINVTGAYLNWPEEHITVANWSGFFYVSIFSMWLGMFVWYRALAMGDAIQVSQLQLMQPFLAIIFSIPILGETVDMTTLLFGVAVVLTVFLGKRMPINVRPISQ
ncbi:DMT family transporter [uncultured Herbaspirillum sp.]|uniref:DMT family transporter n=1 Tax=uncultured Herbaspirillum sp. TaxID=160236 RepID=UPI00258824FD|nr:DMT family transporter [uncultured Herbaspirillum sp.]